MAMEGIRKPIGSTILQIPEISLDSNNPLHVFDKRESAIIRK